MKTFEEKFTAWVDGKLSGSARVDFEHELGADAEAERKAAHRLGDLLRGHLAAPRLTNPDFFNHQLMQQIAAETPPAVPPASRAFAWSLARLAWSGAGCTLMAAALYFALVPKTQKQIAADQEYVANILNARSDDPAVSATAYHDEEQNVTVLWLEGLKYIPADRKLK